MKFKQEIPPKQKQTETEKGKDNKIFENDSWFNSYVLNNEKFKITKTTFPRPFLIQTNEKQYGVLNQDGLYFTDPEDFEKVKDAFYDYEWIVGEMDSRTNNNKHYDPIHIDHMRETLGSINKIFEKSKKISPAFISEKNNEENSKKFYEEFQDYLILLQEPNREKVEDLFSFKFNDLSLREQFYFLNFIKNKNKNGVLPVVNFNKKFKKDGLRTFLSIEQGGTEMGDKILALGDSEKLPEEVARKIFAKYGEIIDNVSKITEFTRVNFNKEIEAKPEFIKKIEETLYIKGKQLLSQTYDDINNKKEINYQDIEKQLDRINADTITTFAIFKQAVKNGEKLPIESIEGSVFSKKEATEISIEQQKEMFELYEINWKNHPDRDFVESLKSYFKTAFSPEDNKHKNYFYTFEKDNNIRAFVRFEEKEKNNLYASALNVDEASKNFGLGEAMMDEALFKEAQKNVLHASCRKDNPSNMRYFEKGFIANSTKVTNNTEEFDLVWDENKNKNIKAKQKSQEDLIHMYGNTNIEEIEIRKSKELISLHENIPENKALVRCFLNNGEWFAVYEKIEDGYGVNLSEVR